jgi:hypothetical protein
MKRLALLVLFTAVSLFAASAPLPTAMHNADEKKTSVTVAPNTLLTIVLPVPDDSASEWQVIGVDVRRLKLTDGPKAQISDKTPTWTVTFRTLRLGPCTVRLVWVPKNGGKEASASALREIAVSIE